MRFYQPPRKDFVGNPGFLIPDYDTPGVDPGTTALEPFTRAGITLPERPVVGTYFKIEASCTSSDGVYCDGDVIDYDVSSSISTLSPSC